MFPSRAALCRALAHWVFSLSRCRRWDVPRHSIVRPCDATDTHSSSGVLKMASKQRVAIVGSGLAGLVSAYLLHHDQRQRYAVKVFESVCRQVILADDD